MCHAGFLSVARKMIKPVAARLRSLLEEDPSRSSCSLIMTGHSAGGAVASLLFAHMLAEGVRSELNILTGCKHPSSHTQHRKIPIDISRLQTHPLHHLWRPTHLPTSHPQAQQPSIPQIALSLLHQRRRSVRNHLSHIFSYN